MGKMHLGTSRAALLLVTTSLASNAAVTMLAEPAYAQATLERTYNFSIPSRPVRQALNDISRVTGLSVVFSDASAASVNGNAVSGSLTREQALSQLLAGTGFSWAFTNARTVTITRVATTASGPADALPDDGSTMLETITVSGNGGSARPGQPFTPDTPYVTAGSVSHISSEQLSRVPASSAGDVFVNTPGVISAGNRIGSSINPNIRGLQGMGRVKTTVDGAEQTTSSYRGYQGNRDETYIDPDMIGGIDVTKGPSGGGFGGSVAIRTLTADDIVKDGKTWGFRVKSGLGGNVVDAPLDGTTVRSDRSGLFGDGSWSGSIAGATTSDTFDFVAAYSRRQQGNYFAGTNVPKGFVFPPGRDVNGDGLIIGPPSGPDYYFNTTVPAGGETFNTSEDVYSVLLKGKAKWGNGQSLELGYLLYNNRYGENDEIDLAIGGGSTAQRGLSTTRVSTYTSKYRWDPDDSDLINFRANLWHSDVDVDRRSNGLDESDSRMRTLGGDLGNTAVIDTALGTLTLDGGLSFARENASALQYINQRRNWDSRGPIGTRLTTSAHLSSKLEVTDWLTMSTGFRYDHYTSEGKGFLSQYPDHSGSRFSPDAGVILTPFEGIQFFGTYKEGYRPPSLRESHWRLDRTLFINPDLKPETSKNWEFGVNVLLDDIFTEGDNLRFKVAYFDNRYIDFIYRDTTVSGSGYQFTNVDEANYEGIEISGAYDAGTWFMEGAFTKYTSIAYCPANSSCFVPAMGGWGAFGSTDAFRNDYFAAYIPPDWAGSLTAGVRLFDKKMTLGSRVNFSSTRYDTEWDENRREGGTVGANFTWPQYAVFDIFGSYKFNDTTTLNFSVENLTDEYYFTSLSSVGIPSPGRTARASLTFKF